jgi:hypothetical protein
VTNLAHDYFTEEELYRIDEQRKVQQSFSYFLNTYAHIEDKETQSPMLFKLWPEQQRILPDLMNALIVIILKARQLGLTWMCAAYCLWFCMTKPMKEAVVISAKGEWAQEFMDRIYFMINFLPSWIYPKIAKSTTEVLRFEHEDGVTSTVKSLTTTEAGAQSKTPDILILDETCWNPYVKQIYNASKPGIDAAGGRIIIISNSIKTAPGWGWTRDMFVKAWKGLIKAKYIFMAWQARPGRPENFRDLQASEEGMDEQLAIEHYPETIEEAISSIGGSYFGASLSRHDQPLMGSIGLVKKNRKGELEFMPQKRGILELWRYPYFLEEGYNDIPWTSRYCIGSDISEGLGQTYSVAYIYDRLLQEFVARVRSNRVDAHTWARTLWELSRYYCNAVPSTPWYITRPALIAVERTGAGQTTIKELKNLGANQYVELIPGKVGSEVTKRLGWTQTQQKKHDLSETLRNWFKTTQGRVHCPILIEEASTWIRHENGTIGPEDDTKFGDCVIAAGLTIEADIFMEGTPKQIPPPLEGWRAQMHGKGKGNWV